MNNKKVLLGLVLAFIVLLGGASVLYTKLGASAAPNQLAAQSQTAEKETANASQGESAEDGAAAKDENPAADDDPARDPSAEETESAQTVPDFTVYDADGNEVHLSDFFGKPIVLNFWASWCGPCKMEMPDFHEKYLELGDEVQFLMVNMTSGRETPEDAKAFIKESRYTFPVFFDTEEIAAYTYGVYSLPTTYFIDADGHGVAYAQGAINGEILQAGLDMILDD